MYASARPSRLTEGFGTSNTSADAELSTSLRNLRSRSRQLVRDAAYAKRAKIVIQNNVVGSGIGMQALVQTASGTMIERINKDIEAAWERWTRADSCHAGGTLHFSDIERLAIGQVFEAGEIFIRKHYRKFGNSEVPFALEVIEPERVPDELQPSPVSENARVRMGVETDEFYRPIAYWVRKLHPGELRRTPNETDYIERVPANQIIHLKVIDRWPQTRGEPWLHCTARKLNDMDGYSEAEIIAARGAATYMGFIESDGEFGEETENGNREVTLEPGIVETLRPGEKFNFASPNRPNANMDPFMRMMLREVAAGVGVSYESLSRDYSQSNYSSSRLSLLEDRDLWRVIQQWFIRTLRAELHREFLQQAIFARAITTIRVDEYALNPEKYLSVRFKPRGWSWVDPTKEVAAYKEAVRGGFSTVSEVISFTSSGRDLEDVLTEREQELKLMAEKGLQFDTDPGAEAKEPAPVSEDDSATDTAGGKSNGNGKKHFN